MKTTNISQQLNDKGFPLFWQSYFILLLIASSLIIFTKSSLQLHFFNFIIHVFVFIGVYAGQRSHKQEGSAHLLLVNGIGLIVVALLLRSLIEILDISIHINFTILVEELGIFLVTGFAYIYMLMLERKFNIKGFSVDYSLLVISCFFFFLLVSPNTLDTLLYELDFGQQLLVINIFIGLMLLTMSIIHYFLSKSIGLTDAARILLTVFIVIHFGLDLLLSLNKFDQVFYITRVSWFFYHLAGTVAILFIFLEKLDLDFSTVAPLRIGNQFMWIASIMAILAIPLGLIIRATQSAPTLSLYLIGIASIFISTIVIWRFIILIKNSNDQRKRLNLLIQTNSLTSLPNYQGYLEKITLSGLKKVLVISINIDDFRAINDLYGRDVGDEVLKSLAKRLNNLPDIILAVHIESDTFLAVFQVENSEIYDLIKSIQAQLGVWDKIQGQKIAVPLTYGLCYTSDLISPERLADNAEQALKTAREMHTSFSVYSEGEKSKKLPRHELRHILQDAVDKDHLPVHFQPIYNLEDGSLKALELLIRVDSDEHGLLMPGQFLDQAKAYGLLTSLTQVCVGMVAKNFETLPNVTININLPPYILKSPKLLSNFIALFDKKELPPKRFCIEITEDGYISAALLIPAIKQLKDHGFLIAMDDFGTGYSSLDRLAVLAVDTVKIDRSLLLIASSGNTAILECAITLAKKLGVGAVVEGVETKEQLSLIKNLGADYVQGFLYSRPVPLQNMTNVALNSNDIITA